MAGATRADLESLKSFVSRQDDGSVRFAYRRDPEVMLRRAILVGSTNDPTPLPNDPSGNRRFVPVLCPKGCDVEYIAEGEREQWWAEGVRRVRDGATGSLPRNLIQDAAERAEIYRNADSYMEDRVADIRPLPDGSGMPLGQIAQQCGTAQKDRYPRHAPAEAARVLTSSPRLEIQARTNPRKTFDSVVFQGMSCHPARVCHPYSLGGWNERKRGSRRKWVV